MTSHDLPVHQSIFEQGCHSVDVILSHLPNVFKEKGERLEDAILDVQLRHTILIHEGGEDGKGGAGFSHNGNGDRGTHSHLSLLHLEVVQERCQYVLWPMNTSSGRKEVCRVNNAFLAFQFCNYLEEVLNGNCASPKVPMTSPQSYSL